MSIIINNLTELYNYLTQDDNLNNSNIKLIRTYSGLNCILLKENLHFLIKLLAFISNRINNNYTNVDQVRIYLIDEIKKILLRINNCNIDPYIPFQPIIIQNTPMMPINPFLVPQPVIPFRPIFGPPPAITPATPFLVPPPRRPILVPQPVIPFRPPPRGPFDRPDPNLFPDAPRLHTTRKPRELGVAIDQEDCPKFAKRQFLNHEELVDYLAPNEASIKADDDGLFIENADGTRCNTQIKFDPDNELYEIIDP